MFQKYFAKTQVYKIENPSSDRNQPQCEVECLTVNTHVAFKPHPTASSQMQLERSLRKQNAK